MAKVCKIGLLFDPSINLIKLPQTLVKGPFIVVTEQLLQVGSTVSDVGIPSL